MTDDGLPDEALAEQIKLRPYQTDAIARINEAIGRGCAASWCSWRPAPARRTSPPP
jgi:hypothetical protein